MVIKYFAFYWVTFYLKNQIKMKYNVMQINTLDIKKFINKIVNKKA